MEPSLADYDVVIAGGGPAGLSAALMFGRARKRALLCDAGTPRNAAAVGVHNFVTRDGISPRDFRAAARADLLPYPSVEVRDVGVVDVAREGELLRVTLADGVRSTARRVLLATGLVDVPDLVPGLREVWGTSAFQCPYCHGWEARDGRWGALATSDALAEWSLLLLGWTRDLIVFTDGRALSEEVVARVRGLGVRVETAKVARVLSSEGRLEGVELAGGDVLRRDVMFARPAQRQVALIEGLGLALDEQGFVKVNELRESSMAGVYVAGDATTMMQGAVLAAAAGTTAAAMLNHALTLEDITHGAG